MPLLFASEATDHSKACRKRTLANFTDIVAGFSYGDNLDMIVEELGPTTSGNGFILAVRNVFHVNETMLEAFRALMSEAEVANYTSEIDLDGNSLIFSVFFRKPKSSKERQCYKCSLSPLLTNPLLYLCLLCVWNPQRYLVFL
tara:strand:+ start:192 stop:620 length:429 start_codon:yes stop_codon:yes gene_type:complete